MKWKCAQWRSTSGMNPTLSERARRNRFHCDA
jgi:hypothetical protein